MSDDKLAQEIERIVLGRVASNRLILPSMPGAPARCLDIIKEPNFAVRKLVQVIEGDPLLALQVMRSANTVTYARGGAIRGLDTALGRLGAQQIRSLIVEFMAHELFQSPDKRIAEANRRVWEHSIVVALIARDVAALLAVEEPDSCYLAGLLHDVGKPVLAAMLLEAERQITRSAKTFIPVSHWTSVVDATHRKVGVALATEWKLPDSITEGIRDCSDYDPGDRKSTSNVVRFANALAKREGYITAPIDAEDVEAMVMVGHSMLGTDNTIIDRLMSGIRPRLPQPSS